MEKKVPKLRFPGFDREWEEKKLGSISKHLEYGLNSAACDYDGENGYIRITDIDTDGNYIKSNQVSPKGIFSDDYLVKVGDILFARTGASTGKNYRYREDDGNLFYAGFLIRARIKKDFNHEYVYYSMKTKRYENWVKLMSMRSGQPGINAKEYSSYSLCVPTKAEQDKLADFLSTIDLRLSLQSAKVDTLTELKKGIIQKIFSQEIRFKREDGTDYSDWDLRKLTDVAVLINGRAYAQNELLSDGKVPVLRVGNFFTNNNWYYSDLELEENKYADYGDLLYAWSATFGPKIWQGEKVIYHYHIWKVIVKQAMYKNFLFHWFMYDVEKVKKVQTGGTMHHITKGNMENREIYCPSIEEQQKIADFLSTIDSKIDIETQILSTLQTLKKGLLQQMFV